MNEILLNEVLIPAAIGGVGGLTRGVVGLLKALSLRRRIIWGYYLITVIVAAIIGIFIGIVFNFDYRLAFTCRLRRHRYFRRDLQIFQSR